MALVDLKSNLANFRSTFTTPSVASQTVTNLVQPTGTHINKASDSNLDIDFNPTSYIGKTGFTKKIINTSKFNIDTVPVSYSGKTNFTKSFIDSSLFERADAFILKYIGKTGFTKNAINKSKFNIDTLPNKFSISTKYTPTNFYPDAKVPKTSARWKGLIPPAVNFFADDKSGAKGFSTKFTDVSQTKFTGATKTSYTYPNLLGLGNRLVSRPLTNSKFPNLGTATLANQLPEGSVFRYTKEGVITSKKFSTQGYSESRKYGDNVKSIKGQSNKSLMFTRATEKNSPSAIDEQYAKFNLRDEAFNPTYIKQPYILRGIQRKEKHEPQRWGTGTQFDDGLIRGGFVTVVDRVKADFDRIKSWITSPKGHLWIVKQVGLGRSNPKVETAGLLVPRLTRIHTGIASLLSVAGSPFGLHFTRHGIPFANNFASYENVQKIKKLKFDISPSRSNRLIDLRNDLVLNINKRKKPSLIVEGQSIPSLSGISGPNSIYGIGFTDISRGSKSIKGDPASILERIQINPFTISRNYAGNKAGQNSAIAFGIDGYKREINYFRPDLETISNNLFNLITIINGQNTVAKDYNANPYNPNVVDKESKDLADRKQYSTKQYAGNLRAKTKHDFDPNKDTNNNTAANIDAQSSADPETRDSLYTLLSEKKRSEQKKNNKRPFSIKKQYASGLVKFSKPNATKNDDVNGLKTIEKLDNEFNDSIKKQYESSSASTFNTRTIVLSDKSTKDQPNPFNRLPDIPRGAPTETTIDRLDYNGPNIGNIRNYATMAYGKIPKNSSDRYKLNGDFRNGIDAPASSLSFIGQTDPYYYRSRRLEGYYGFGNLGQVGADRSKPNEFAATGSDFGNGNRTIIVEKKSDFRGDKVNALDVNLSGITTDKIYDGTKDLIKFYFQDGALAKGSVVGNYAVMAFRATMTGFTDSFSPGWDRIDIMGRPDGAYLYNSFERNVSFNFTVAAMSRSEMIPMWRKLNYLASYTMPDFSDLAKPSGPFMRITIGDLFYQTPGFITSLSYTIPDDATWDIAEDVDNNADAKQLPMVVEASISFTIVGDYRPQMHGRVYSLSPKGTRNKNAAGQWLGDASIGK